MSQWANFGISAVRYNTEHSHIVEVIRRQDLGTSFGPEERRSRALVVSDINNGTRYVTIVKNANGKWDMGAKVQVVVINSQYYIKTVSDGTPTDNLGNLPEY